ncbi:hypothetical protein ALC62_00506 [Cyphomyrmex costatus]|uniref:Uncharacterized protein n=1 Tax=Cyphomyrmex costatus TaxID=456900 RepID=A0A195D6L5_9HYME|nr:hypothetical protein ALC62_00506 [Cyphomyrmex costatus]
MRREKERYVSGNDPSEPTELQRSFMHRICTWMQGVRAAAIASLPRYRPGASRGIAEGAPPPLTLMRL